MSTDEPMLLRDVAKLAALLPGVREGTIGVRKLLILLREGELTAQFQLQGKSDEWFSIPRSYWVGVHSDEFRDIRYSSTRRNAAVGAFKISFVDLSRIYTNSVYTKLQQEVHQGKTVAPDTIMREMEYVISLHDILIEPFVFTSSWEEYLSKHGIKLPDTPHTSGNSRGRKEKESWKPLCVYIGAYFEQHKLEPGRTKIEPIANDILEKAKLSGVADLPNVRAVQDIVSKIIDEIKRAGAL